MFKNMFYFKVKLSTSTFISYMVYHLHAVGYWILPMAVDTGVYIEIVYRVVCYLPRANSGSFSDI